MLKSTLIPQCLKQLRDPLYLNSVYPGTMDHDEIENIRESLAESERFVIPNGDSILWNKPTLADFDQFHSPYPIVSLEYSITNPDFVEGSPNQKIDCVTLLLESDLSNQSEQDTSSINIDGFLIAGFYKDPHTGWRLKHSGIALDKNQKFGLAEDYYFTNNISSSVTAVVCPVLLHEVAALDAKIKQTITDPDPYLVKEEFFRLAKDLLAPDLAVVLNFLAAIQCKNVVTETIHTASRLNLKRVKENPAKYRFHVLKIDLKSKIKHESLTSADPPHDKRKSPRFHLRRGHSRRLPSGDLIWINPMSVGALTNGVVLKDYLWQ